MTRFDRVVAVVMVICCPYGPLVRGYIADSCSLTYLPYSYGTGECILVSIPPLQQCHLNYNYGTRQSHLPYKYGTCPYLWHLSYYYMAPPLQLKPWHLSYSNGTCPTAIALVLLLFYYY